MVDCGSNGQRLHDPFQKAKKKREFACSLPLHPDAILFISCANVLFKW